MSSLIEKTGRVLLLGGLAFVLVGCAAPRKMTKVERETLMENCEELKPTGSGIERNLCVSDTKWVRSQGRVPYYWVARRPISDFKEP